jgi:AraC-like DNA-binding protein
MGTGKMKKKYDTLTGAGRFFDGLPFQYHKADHTQAYQGWHDHDFNEIVLILSGKGYHKTLYGKRRIKKGSILFVPPHRPHSYKPDQKIEVLNLIFTEEFFDQIDQFCSGRGDFRSLFDAHRGIPLQLKPDELIVCEMLGDRLEQELAERSESYQGMVRSLFSEFAISLMRSEHNAKMLAQQARQTEAEKSITRTIKFIGTKYSEKLTLKDIAAEGAYSPAYMSSFFKKNTGYTLSEYINEVRIQRACESLAKTDRAILDVALDVGFNSISLFNRTFKKLIGATPREYRGKQVEGAWGGAAGMVDGVRESSGSGPV